MAPEIDLVRHEPAWSQPAEAGFVRFFERVDVLHHCLRENHVHAPWPDHTVVKPRDHVPNRALGLGIPDNGQRRAQTCDARRSESSAETYFIKNARGKGVVIKPRLVL